MKSGKKIYLAIEFVVLFFGIPTWIYLDKDFMHPSIIILPVLAFIFLLLRGNPDFHWKELVRWSIPRKALLANAGLVLLASLLMLGYVLVFERENLFNLPRANIWIYLGLCLFYPVFSAYGQEIIYRTFLRTRYKSILPKAWHFGLASGLTFSYMHIVYYHPISMILTLIGGLYFAKVYWETRSVLFASVLHGIIGIILFGIGLGQYFWLDMPV